MRTDPFRDLDRLTQQVFGTAARPTTMPMDAWRENDSFVVEFDLPGIDANSIDLDVERNVLTVRADRPAREGIEELVAAERPRGVFSRQLILGDNLDTDKIAASYHAGVLRLEIPVAEKAKPRKILINAAEDHRVINA
jgi:HSP20 family protein